MRAALSWQKRLKEPQVLVWVILAALLLACAIASPLFLEPENLDNVFLVQPVGLGLAALGQAFVVISGGIDLSIGSLISLLSSLAAGLYRSQPGLNPVLVALFLVGLGAAAGAINGMIVVRLRVTPFMATLATMSLFQGAVLFYAPRTIGGHPEVLPLHFRRPGGRSPGRASSSSSSSLRRAGTCLRMNRLGKHIYAVGSDPYVSQISGIPVRRVRFLSYLICGILVGRRLRLHGIAAGRRRAEGGRGLRAGLHHGGWSLAASAWPGGSGSVLGTFAGVLIIGVFYNIMNLLSVNAYLQIVLKGLVLIAAVSFYAKRRV